MIEKRTWKDVDKFSRSFMESASKKSKHTCFGKKGGDPAQVLEVDFYSYARGQPTLALETLDP